MFVTHKFTTRMHGRTNSVEEVLTNTNQQGPVLYRSYTCKRQQSFRHIKSEFHTNLFLQKPPAYSTPTSPNIRSQRKLSYQKSFSRTGSSMSQDSIISRKSSTPSFSERISSILSIPSQVLENQNPDRASLVQAVCVCYPCWRSQV